MFEQLLADEREYLARYMTGVSRSFALVAPEVESPLDDYLATAYLICRVVDNIEDTMQPFSWQQARFAELIEMLNSPQEAAVTLARWGALEWPSLTEREQSMMSSEDGGMLWQIYDKLPDRYRDPICRWATEMAFGMERSGNPLTSDYFFSQKGVRLPHTKADYDLYCFYVAGTVGRMITELAILFYEVGEDTSHTLTAGSDACGRALQKTNIIKDFVRDLRRGVCFLPDAWLREVDYAPLALAGVPASWKAAVILDVVRELEDSVPYVLALPPTAVGFRRAGLLMMLPAYETMLLAARKVTDLFTARHEVKISRAAMGQCVLRARQIAGDDAAISAYAQRMSGRIREHLAAVNGGGA
ncbi:MAG: squalene/phytoene synthase family protein [Candidatus Promineifilaceae bacterium]